MIHADPRTPMLKSPPRMFETSNPSDRADSEIDTAAIAHPDPCADRQARPLDANDPPPIDPTDSLIRELIRGKPLAQSRPGPNEPRRVGIPTRCRRYAGAGHDPPPRVA